VVIQNLAPGSAHRMGLGAADVVARFPRAIAVDISGYGVGGPYDEKRAYDLLIQAEGGLCSITGLPEPRPRRARRSPTWAPASTR
jgi:itaconate CoA-transferase